MLYYSSMVKCHSEMIYNEVAHVKKKMRTGVPSGPELYGV